MHNVLIHVEIQNTRSITPTYLILRQSFRSHTAASRPMIFQTILTNHIYLARIETGLVNLIWDAKNIDEPSRSKTVKMCDRPWGYEWHGSIDTVGSYFSFTNRILPVAEIKSHRTIACAPNLSNAVHHG